MYFAVIKQDMCSFCEMTDISDCMVLKKYVCRKITQFFSEISETVILQNETVILQMT